MYSSRQVAPGELDDRRPDPLDDRLDRRLRLVLQRRHVSQAGGQIEQRIGRDPERQGDRQRHRAEVEQPQIRPDRPGDRHVSRQARIPAGRSARASGAGR